MTTPKPPRPGTAQCVYQLRVELLHVEPQVWRSILVPDHLSLAKLDRVIQAVRGWNNTHLHAWHIQGKRYGRPDAEWDAPGALLDDRKFTVGTALGDEVIEFVYLYDFGDGWEHRVVVEKRLPAKANENTWPMCTAGANACPPDDVGGPPGYMDFVQAMRDIAHRNHLQMWRWYGGPFDPSGFSINEANRAIKRLR